MNALPLHVIVLAAGEEILGLFGPAYAHHGIHLLWVLTIASIPDAITNLYVPVLRVRGRLRAAGTLTMSMAGVALAGAWLAAPGGGLTGIGLAWLAAQSLGSAWVAFDVLLARHALRRGVAA